MRRYNRTIYDVALALHSRRHGFRTKRCDDGSINSGDAIACHVNYINRTPYQLMLQ